MLILYNEDRFMSRIHDVLSKLLFAQYSMYLLADCTMFNIELTYCITLKQNIRIILIMKKHKFEDCVNNYFIAISEISTSASLGSFATWYASRAG